MRSKGEGGEKGVWGWGGCVCGGWVGGGGVGVGGGAVQISADDIVRQSLKLKM